MRQPFARPYTPTPGGIHVNDQPAARRRVGGFRRDARHALHPDLAKRRVLGDTPDERLGLRRMSKEELVELTRQGALKTPKEQWDRSCTVLDVAGDTATVRLETPWFVDSFHMGKFDDRWIIINALWYAKPR